MPESAVLSLSLVIVGILIAPRSGRAWWLCAAFFAGALASMLAVIAHLSANYFTGEGINAATLFHLQYGLGGAGVGDYRKLILVGGAAVAFAIIFVGFFSFWRRKKPRHVGAMLATSLAIGASLLTNPGLHDLTRLNHTSSDTAVNFTRYYRAPALTEISPDHRNFIYIFAESLERTYFDEKRFPDLIKELRLIEAESVSFRNIQTVEGTGFTMGGIVAALCGIPLFAPANGNSMSGMDAFLPGARGLSDALHEEGYFLSFLGGASLRFAGKDKFLKSHSFDEIFGMEELQSRLADPSYRTAWGLYDDSMLEFAFDRFVTLSKEKKRFGLFLLTLDTHHPDGHVSRSVGGRPYGDGKNPILNSVAGSDQLLAAFIRRVRASPEGKNVVIILASDHLSMANSAYDLLRSGERRNLFFVTDPKIHEPAQVQRTGSSLDIPATVLPFLGYRSRIGLGRDLRDPDTSDADLAIVQKTETLVSWKKELGEFWSYPHLRHSIRFQQEPPRLTIDGRIFGAPVLVQLDKTGRTTLRFEFDAEWDVRLAQQVKALAPGTSFLLVAARKDVLALFPSPETVPPSAWTLVIGKAGLGQVAVPLADGAHFTKKQVDSYLSQWP